MEITISLADDPKRLALFGSNDKHLRLIRQELNVQITARDSTLRVTGSPEAVDRAAAVIEDLRRRLKTREHLSTEEVGESIGREVAPARPAPVTDGIPVYAPGSGVKPKTEGQRRYAEAMRENDLVFCLGPAGTGKTYLAVATAVSALKAGKIKRIVLVRPAVEAGEKLGYLPGDIQAKVNPYLRPLLDALHDMMGFEQVRRFTANDIIEIIPLAFMRGRTLNDSVVILDEAQNTTVGQMLMFLTRLGENSKMIVTGDHSQVDLPDTAESGLVDAVKKLEGITGIGVVRLDKADIVRHKLVQAIVAAYGTTGPA